jgi:peptidoglycan/LPS O-acetylase OafA/YrhL
VKKIPTPTIAPIATAATCRGPRGRSAVIPLQMVLGSHIASQPVLAKKRPVKLKEIERLRAAAILMVMSVHWIGATAAFLPTVAQKSWSGVDLFFVISGYVVTLSLVRLLPALESEPSFVEAFDRAKQALKIFYTRRFFRIVPAAFTAAFLSLVLSRFLPQFGTTETWVEEMVAFFGGIYNYVEPYHVGQYHFGIYWSLSVEEHFYLILPILFVAFRTTSRRLAACAAIAGFCVLARFVGPLDGKAPPPDYEKIASHLRFDSLMAGVTIALVAGRTAVAATAPILPRWLPRFLLLPACLVLVAILPGAAPEYAMNRVGFVALWLLSGVVVAYAGLDRGYVLPVPVLDRALEYVGSRSYALYLLHLVPIQISDGIRPFWPAFDRAVPRDAEHPARLLLFLLVVALGLAELLHQLVEKPSIRIGRALASGASGPVISVRGRWALAVLAFVLAVFLFRHR